MNAGDFLIALAALSIGTYLMRFAGVKLGAAIATKGRRRTPVTASVGAERDPTGADAPAAGGGDSATAAGGAGPAAVENAAPADSTERVTKWMDRATVVLIGAVFATTAIFDGKDIADPARLIGVGVGVFAAIVRVPMLLAVAIGMAVCAVIRMTGVL
ncbi:AzlD domain-containing protein [Brevibacterium sp. S111]|uniref:AzlD domain-containing protein n=1 Tax=unclassified Brevibacterium TaxID=2614124 RepID=UPI00107FF759|nr:AzlD domain-containing protein [Brevibacterium sp. S111]TGD11799.1 AzlD domain-containing protein [Brevibacterium sp. S111]